MKKGIFLTGVPLSLGILLGGGIVHKALRIKCQKDIEMQKEYTEKHLDMFLFMSKWLEINQKGFSIKKYFTDNGYKAVAIYGMSDIGKRICDELSGTDIKVMYAIDKKQDIQYKGIHIYSLEDKLPEVDAIVVAAYWYFDEIAEKLYKKVDCPVLNINDIIYEFEYMYSI